MDNQVEGLTIEEQRELVRMLDSVRFKQALSSRQRKRLTELKMELHSTQ